MAVLVAIVVNADRFREVLGAAEGMKEHKASWVSSFQWLCGRGLDGVKLVVGDKCLGMLEAVGEVFPDGNSALCWSARGFAMWLALSGATRST